MKRKIMTILLGGVTGFLSVSVAQADSAYERALGVGINQGYQGASRSGTEIYPGVWSQGRSDKEVIREEIYPGVWTESSVRNQGMENVSNNNQSGYSIVNRSTSGGRNGSSGSINERQNNQIINTEIEEREEDSREKYRRNSRINSSSSGSFSGRSSVNTPVSTIPGVTVREREHTNVPIEDLINPEFD